MRLVFAGTPDVAVPALDALLASTHDVVAVVTRPDARSGRGRRLAPSPVADRAEEAGIEALKPARVKDRWFLDRLREIAPDCAPVVAYGALIPPEALAVPRYGWVNLHFSILPAWRGAAPVQHALLHGDDVTGATTFRLDEGMDTGPVYGVLTETVRDEDTSGDLLRRLAAAGAELLVATLDAIERGDAVAVPQLTDGVSLAPKLTTDDVRADWGKPAVHLARLTRAAAPAPGAWTTFRGDRIGLGPVRSARAGPVGDLAPGQIRVAKDTVLVGTGDGAAIALGEVRPSGRRAMPADAWARGIRDADGDRFV